MLQSKILAAAFAAALAVFAASAANAQATRTWVSGVGDDVNPCSRTAPCKTFAGAISKTAAGGEINCLDPGGFGTLTVTKSIIVDCGGTFGSALNSGGINGFSINDSATGTPGTVVVTLRNLSIDGAGTTKGLNGIRFISGSILHVENVVIKNQSGMGISVAATNNLSAKIFVRDTIISETSGGGVQIIAQGTGTIRASFDNVRFDNTGGFGLQAQDGVIATVTNSVSSNNTVGFFAASFNRGVDILLDRVQVSDNTRGLVGAGSNGSVRVSNSLITGSSLALDGNVISLGGNSLTDNGTEGTFTSTVAKK